LIAGLTDATSETKIVDTVREMAKGILHEVSSQVKRFWFADGRQPTCAPWAGSVCAAELAGSGKGEEPVLDSKRQHFLTR